DDGWCAALDRDSLRCRIYAWRPLVCREFVMGGPDCRIERGRLDDGWCAALDRDSLRCRIYAWRPLVCREFVMGGPDCRIERGIAE
uniref:YkgJ family cysteine cluster protein n=1 Tax=uncultured Thiocystis sp. TaxID=1202134 RepID=UPI0025D56710